ncbi:MAG: type IV pili twitching motility protein PilT, partial [Methylococcales bacterium]|nr:type IV pili twitching motility protein PilT [Methylococcales bacterium]
DLIAKGDISGMKPIMAKSRELGMQTFDQALFDLYQTGIIGYDEALKHADSKNELRLQIKLSVGVEKETFSLDMSEDTDTETL